MTRVYITAAWGISGIDSGIPDPRKLSARNAAGHHPFMPLREAMEWLPFDLKFEVTRQNNSLSVDLDEYLGGYLICPVQMTNRELEEHLGERPKRLGRHQLLASLAATQAMANIWLTDPNRYGVVGGTGGAGLDTSSESTLAIVEKTKGRRLGNAINKYLPNIFVGLLANQHGIGGPSEVHGTACAASGDAINSAFRMIRSGEINGALVVGTEATINPLGMSSFADPGVLGNGRTFQQDRSGFVMGEGAAALFIESEESMEHHGRKPLMEILGIGSSSDAVLGGTIMAPDSKGQARAIRRALTMANMELRDIDVVKVHGTATELGDPIEIASLHQADDENGNSGQAKVIAPKSWCGHLLGASSAYEIVMLIGMQAYGKLLPTRGLATDNIDPTCVTVRHPTMLEDLEPGTTFLVNAFGFGGTNAVQVVRGVG